MRKANQKPKRNIEKKDEKVIASET